MNNLPLIAYASPV